MPVTTEQAIADIADVLYLEPADLTEDADLRDLGMNSIRIMTLVERWRTAGVSKIDFIVLAENQTLRHWTEALTRLQAGDTSQSGIAPA